MANRWYYTHANNKLGPFSAQELQDLAANGSVLATDTIWKAGVEKGMAANKVKNLFLPSVVAAPMHAHIPQPAGTPLASDLAAGTTSLGAETPSLADEQPTLAEPLAGTEPAESIPGQTWVAGDSAAMAIAATALAPVNPPPTAAAPAKKGRAVAKKGADIMGQDGSYAKYRMKCTECGHKDKSCRTIPISNKVMKSGFFCPKCRKQREVVIQCQAG